jgi:hypothetical protein
VLWIRKGYATIKVLMLVLICCDGTRPENLRKKKNLKGSPFNPPGFANTMKPKVVSKLLIEALFFLLLLSLPTFKKIEPF